MNRTSRFSRFRETWLWWKHTWWFQLAHAPLCDAFHRDVWRIGRIRVCRSCTLLYAAMAVSAGVLLCVPLERTLHLLLCYGLLAAILGLSYPPLYSSLPRLARDVIRFGTGVFLALLLTLAVHGMAIPAIVTLVGLVPVFFFFQRKRQEHKQGVCGRCSEFGPAAVCSGYAPQAESIRAFQHSLEEELNDGRFVPVAVLTQKQRNAHTSSVGPQRSRETNDEDAIR